MLARLKFYLVLSLIHLYKPHKEALANDAQERIKSGYVMNYDKLAKYAVSIQLYPEKAFGLNFHCAGSIITEKVILTAANCLFHSNYGKYPTSNLQVTAGNVYRRKEVKTMQKRYVAYYVIHPDYKYGNSYADLALLILQEAFIRDAAYVQRVNLNKIEPQPGLECTALGWGSSSTEEERSPRLQYINLTIAPSKTCNEVNSGYFCVEDKTKSNRMVCAADEGGPFICNGDTLVGLITEGVYCRQVSSFTTFLDVHFFRNWIVNETIRGDRSGSNKVSPHFQNISLLLLLLTNKFLK